MENGRKKPERQTEDTPYYRKGLPNNLEAERSILGGILLDNSLYYSAVELRAMDYFFLESHRAIFRKMAVLNAKGSSIDLVTLSEELRKSEEFERAGGAQYIASLIDGVPRTDTIRPYVGIIKNKYMLRRLISISEKIKGLAFNEEDEPEEIVSKAETAIFELSDESRGTAGPEDTYMVAARYADHVEAKSQDPRKIIGIPSGYPDIDKQTLGFQQGLTLIAAESSAGKTAWSINIASHLAFAGYNVYYASVESGSDKIISRILSSEARVDSYRLREGRMNKAEWDSVIDVVQRLSHANFVIDDDPDITPDILTSRCIQFATARGGIDCVFVDYVQLMNPGIKCESRREEVRHIGKGLVRLSRKLKVPVIGLAQLNDDPGKRPDHKPRVNDLGESKSLRHDADLVMLIFRPEQYKRTEENRGKATIIFGKNRDGATEDVELTYIPQYTRFESAWKEKEN
jgi:replicative DNA helicase